MTELNEILANASEDFRRLNMAKRGLNEAKQGLESVIGNKPKTPRKQPEKELEQFVHDTAKRFGLLYYHTYRSKFSEPGLPDCLIGRDWSPCKLLVAELKDTGKEPTKAQWRWLDFFRACGIPAYIWHPEQKDGIVKVLADLAGKEIIC